MDRRRALLAFASLAAATPFARAQTPRKLPIVAYIANVVPQTELDRDPDAAHPYFAAFTAGLREHGWHDGRNVRIVWRSAEGREEDYYERARELVRMPVDVIVAFGTGVTAAASATGTIPIVMGSHYRPLRFAASLARPGRNVTGITSTFDLKDGIPKQLAFLKAVAPKVVRIAWITGAQADRADQFQGAVAQYEAETTKLGVKLEILTVGGADTLDAAIDSAARQGYHAVWMDDFNPMHFAVHRRSVAARALRNRLPMMVSVPGAASDGALLDYGVDNAIAYRRIGYFVDRILRGEKPGDIPIELPTSFALGVNLQTARALGLRVPESVLLQASQVSR